MARFVKFERCIFGIELTKDSKHIKFAEKRKDIIDPINALYDTTEFKIIDITVKIPITNHHKI